ncbi:hypothetical protein SERLA73DRAFT_72012 [Serpula lacrymans var. lacrymans S7.3]|uniref:Uncharacterized protein n=1 Tax=Serpula lacrymans var. lacrymans (strain S7.3) TaxID=936435 RepID=F8PTP9_SERL3|nr:hypothetical protein SERLA73DRAFT_72012 [Serpula lacrymans var. lacrymans S7.3]
MTTTIPHPLPNLKRNALALAFAFERDGDPPGLVLDPSLPSLSCFVLPFLARPSPAHLPSPSQASSPDSALVLAPASAPALVLAPVPVPALPASASYNPSSVLPSHPYFPSPPYPSLQALSHVVLVLVLVPPSPAPSPAVVQAP